jgi:hypothetical protein
LTSLPRFARQLGHESHLARAFLGREKRGDVAGELALGNRFRGGHVGRDPLAEVVVRHAHDRDLSHSGVLQQRVGDEIAGRLR